MHENTTIWNYFYKGRRLNPAYDMAVIVLKDNLVLSRSIQLANLPKINEPCPSGRNLVLSGWGEDIMRPYRSQSNLWAVVQECLNMSSCPRVIDMYPETNFLCIGDSENSLNSGCFGDSGGNSIVSSKFE